MTALRLDNLPEDVLLKILVFTDIYTVLTLSRVNGHLRAITSVKQLWVLLTSDLLMRGLFEASLEEILVKSSEELKAEVKRIVCGPRTWSPDSNSVPALNRRYWVPLGDNRASSIVLVPGGEYLVIRKYTDRMDTNLLECWNIRAQRRAWTWSRIGCTINDFKFTACRGSKMIASLKLRDPSLSISHLLLVEVDLDTGSSREIFQISPFHFYGQIYSISQVEDDYFSCVLATDYTVSAKMKLLLVNHRTEQYVTFEYSDAKTEIRIVPYYVFLTCPANEPVSVHVYTIASLQPFWKPLVEIDLESTLADVMTSPLAVLLVREHLTPVDKSRFQALDAMFTIDQSLLRRETFLLRLTDRNGYLGDSTTSIHRLDFSHLQEPRCVLLSSVDTENTKESVGICVSRGGYTLSSATLCKEGIMATRQRDHASKFIPFENGTRRARGRRF
ncbi:hypothetical protein R3P38DRAFT_3251932 [Favolaschia claudopus]|uniref:F-box domain-containing protein n=1 Tax=Favolaschia claudopus TaxID=2862362 RepID=A0AAW0E9B1_9AGAR